MCFLIVSVTKSYLTHCNPMDCSPARLLCPWDFPRQEYCKVKATQSCPTLCDPMDCSPWDFPGQNTGTGSLSGDLPNPGIKPRLPHCRRILYQLNHKRSPRILEQVAYPFSSRSSQPSNQTGVSCIAGRFFTN